MIFKKISLFAIMFFCSNFLFAKESTYSSTQADELSMMADECDEDLELSTAEKIKKCLCSKKTWIKNNPKTSLFCATVLLLTGYTIYKKTTKKVEVENNEKDNFNELDMIENLEDEESYDE